MFALILGKGFRCIGTMQSYLGVVTYTLFPRQTSTVYIIANTPRAALTDYSFILNIEFTITTVLFPYFPLFVA